MQNTIERDRYIDKISRRGSAYGADGGTLDLLNWCGKIGLMEVTAEEARRFWEHPDAPYSVPAPESAPG